MKNAIVYGVTIVIAQVIAGLIAFKYFTSKGVMKKLTKNSVEMSKEILDELDI